MPSVPVQIQPAILSWVMNKTKATATNPGVTDLIGKWISGEKEPTFNQVEEVSKKTSIPFGYFFLREPPVEECHIVDYRTIDSALIDNPSRELIDTIDQMSSIQEWMAEYNKENGASGYAFVGSIRIGSDLESAASTIRGDLGLDVRWFDGFRNPADAFRHLRNAVMGLGVLVMMNGVVGNNTHRSLSVDEFRAFAMADRYAPLIFINSKDTDNGKLFSLLHELAHIYLGRNSFYNDMYGLGQAKSDAERFCNAVAVEILVPDACFSEEWDKQTGGPEDRIEELRKHFVCSRFVLLRKALDAGNVDGSEYKRLSALYQSRFLDHQKKSAKEGVSGGGDFYRTLKSKWDNRFLQALYASVQSGRTQYRDAYRMTNTTGKTFHELLGKAGGAE